MADELNESAEFGRKHKNEEDPILVAQRFLNIFRQMHIFNNDRREQFDNMLLDMPPDIRILLSTLPGGSLLIEHIEELEKKNGLVSMPAPTPTKTSTQTKKSEKDEAKQAKTNTGGGTVVIDASFANELSSSLSLALQQTERRYKEDIKTLTETITQSIMESQSAIGNMIKDVLLEAQKNIRVEKEAPQVIVVPADFSMSGKENSVQSQIKANDIQTSQVTTDLPENPASFVSEQQITEPTKPAVKDISDKTQTDAKEDLAEIKEEVKSEAVAEDLPQEVLKKADNDKGLPSEKSVVNTKTPNRPQNRQTESKQPAPQESSAPETLEKETEKKKKKKKNKKNKNAVLTNNEQAPDKTDIIAPVISSAPEASENKENFDDIISDVSLEKLELPEQDVSVPELRFEENTVAENPVTEDDFTLDLPQDIDLLQDEDLTLEQLSQDTNNSTSPFDNELDQIRLALQEDSANTEDIIDTGSTEDTTLPADYDSEFVINKTAAAAEIENSDKAETSSALESPAPKAPEEYVSLDSLDVSPVSLDEIDETLDLPQDNNSELDIVPPDYNPAQRNSGIQVQNEDETPTVSEQPEQNKTEWVYEGENSASNDEGWEWEYIDDDTENPADEEWEWEYVEDDGSDENDWEWEYVEEGDENVK